MRIKLVITPQNGVLLLAQTGKRMKKHHLCPGLLGEVNLKVGERFVQLKVAGMDRIPARTSKCGSVVEIWTDQGILTLDDYSISVDRRLSMLLRKAER